MTDRLRIHRTIAILLDYDQLDTLIMILYMFRALYAHHQEDELY